MAVGDAAANMPADDCLDGAAPFSGTVDDLMIEVVIPTHRRRGGVLGQAGPCLTGATDHLSRVGVMEFDSADVVTMESNGTFDDVVLHEMGHVLGIGTLWIGTAPSCGAPGRATRGSAVPEVSPPGPVWRAPVTSRSRRAAAPAPRTPTGASRCSTTSS